MLKWDLCYRLFLSACPSPSLWNANIVGLWFSAILGSSMNIMEMILLCWFQVNYLSFNPYNEWILATASSDTTIGLFDTRKLSMPLHVLSSHTYALHLLIDFIFRYHEWIICEWPASCLPQFTPPPSPSSSFSLGKPIPLPILITFILICVLLLMAIVVETIIDAMFSSCQNSCQLPKIYRLKSSYK